jgi:hypothetical protein
MHVLGRNGDPAQFIEFEWPAGCALHLSTFIEGRLVSVEYSAGRWNSLMRHPMPPVRTAERIQLRTSVANAYIAALQSHRVAMPANMGIEERAGGLSSWLSAAESLTYADSRTLMWTGPIRFNARPAFSIRLLQLLPDATVTMRVKTLACGFITSHPIRPSDDMGETTTVVRATGASGTLLACDVLRALCDVTSLGGHVTALLDEYDFGIRIAPRQSGDDAVLLDSRRRTNFKVHVNPFRPCNLCGSLIRDGNLSSCIRRTNEWEHAFEDVSVCKRCMSDCRTPVAARHMHAGGTSTGTVDCGQCNRPACRGPPRLCSAETKHARLWSANAEATLQTHNGARRETDGTPVCDYYEYVRYSNASGVVHSDADDTPRPSYYAECAAVPGALRSIWQQMACDARWVREMLLSLFGAGSLKLKLKSKLTLGSDSEKYMFDGGGHLRMLSLEIMHLILTHVMRAVLPPSREQLSRGAQLMR